MVDALMVSIKNLVSNLTRCSSVGRTPVLGTGGIFARSSRVTSTKNQFKPKSMKQKVNFTTENLSRLKELALEVLFNNYTFKGVMNSDYTIIDILFNLSLNSLENIYNQLDKELAKFNKVSRWTSTEEENTRKSLVELKKEFINLVIGYKLYLAQQAEHKAAVEKVQEELNEWFQMIKDTLDDYFFHLVND